MELRQILNSFQFLMAYIDCSYNPEDGYIGLISVCSPAVVLPQSAVFVCKMEDSSPKVSTSVQGNSCLPSLKHVSMFHHVAARLDLSKLRSDATVALWAPFLAEQQFSGL